MRQRIAKESHATQNNIGAHHRAEHSNKDRGDHAALHEFVLERFQQQHVSLIRWTAIIHQHSSPGVNFQAASIGLQQVLGMHYILRRVERNDATIE